MLRRQLVHGLDELVILQTFGVLLAVAHGLVDHVAEKEVLVGRAMGIVEGASRRQQVERDDTAFAHPLLDHDRAVVDVGRGQNATFSDSRTPMTWRWYIWLV